MSMLGVQNSLKIIFKSVYLSEIRKKFQQQIGQIAEEVVIRGAQIKLLGGRVKEFVRNLVYFKVYLESYMFGSLCQGLINLLVTKLCTHIDD